MVALNTAYAAPKNAADPKNRVGDFFYEDHASVGKKRWANRLNTQEKSSYHYETASGRSNWPNRDPIGEWGGINLYEFVRNNGVNRWDFLGLAEESFSDGFIEKLVADWYDKVITREIREKSYKKRSYDTQNCCCNIETHHISDHQDTTVKRLSVKDITITVTATSSIDTSHLVGDWIATLAGLMPFYGNIISVANQVKNTFVDTTNVSFDVSTSESNEYEIEKVDSEQKTQWFNAYHRISGPYCDNTISSADCTDDPDPGWTYSEEKYN